MAPTERPPIGTSSTPVRDDDVAAFAVQGHGVVLVVADPDQTIVQVSANVGERLGWEPTALLGHPIDHLGHDLAQAVRTLQAEASLGGLQPQRVRIDGGRGPLTGTLSGHRVAPGQLLVELDDLQRRTMPMRADLTATLSTIVARLGAATSLPALGEILAAEVRELTGYDRVLIHRFDEAGHTEVIAEARRRGLTSYLHRRFPSSTVPTIEGERLRSRRCFLLADASAASVPLRAAADMPRERSLERSLERAQIGLAAVPEATRARLRGEGILATFEAALMHEGRLWGVISCHHHAARHLPFDLRAACELIAEVVSTRIAALEHYAEAQAEVLVRRLEHRLIEATGGDGDWRRALFETPRQLLQPLGATGAALLFDGEISSTGEVPALGDLRALFSWLDTQEVRPLFATSSIARLHPPLGGLTRAAAGVLAVRVGGGRGEYLAWFRREQVRDVTWGTGPQRARSEVSAEDEGAAPIGWHELVRDTALSWKMRECAIAKAIGASLADMVLQLRAVRVLIAENQLAAMRRAIEASDDPVVIADDGGEILVATRALDRLIAGPHRTIETLADLAACFDDVPQATTMLQQLLTDRRPWRGELRLMARAGEPGTPVALRADPIPGFDGGLFGVILMLTDLTHRHAADEARERVQRTIFSSQRPTPGEANPVRPSVQALVSAIWANAGVAVSEIADSADVGSIAPLLHEVESATQHAVRLSALLARLAPGDLGDYPPGETDTRSA